MHIRLLATVEGEDTLDMQLTRNPLHAEMVEQLVKLLHEAVRSRSADVLRPVRFSLQLNGQECTAVETTMRPADIPVVQNVLYGLLFPLTAPQTGQTG